jgi:hypothetical protein
MEERVVESKSVELNGGDERDEMASSRLPIKIHAPELPDVMAPDDVPPEIAEHRPTLSIHTEPEDD